MSSMLAHKWSEAWVWSCSCQPGSPQSDRAERWAGLGKISASPGSIPGPIKTPSVPVGRPLVNKTDGFDFHVASAGRKLLAHSLARRGAAWHIDKLTSLCLVEIPTAAKLHSSTPRTRAPGCDCCEHTPSSPLTGARTTGIARSSTWWSRRAGRARPRPD